MLPEDVAVYRIVELDGAGHREIARFDSAYAGLDHMRQSLLSDGAAARRWRLLGPDDSVLLEPEDVIEAA